MFARVEHALRRRASDDDFHRVEQTGRLFIVPSDTHADSTTSRISDLPVRFIASSDLQLVAARRAVSSDDSHLLSARREGKYVLSYKTAGGWTAITKDILTDVIGAGSDAKIVGVPAEAAAVVKLMCPALVILSPATRQN
jgi:hypothetical protein